MAFNDYREPIEYVVDRYFKRQKWYDSNNLDSEKTQLKAGEFIDDSLPDIPCKIIRDEKEQAYKFIYGEIDLLETDEECSPVIWQQEIIRNSNGIVEKIKTTYPDGSSVEEELIRDNNGLVSDYRIKEGE